MPLPESPRLSILLPTRRGWPIARRAVEGFASEIDPTRDEVVVLDGSRGPVPDDLPPGVRWVPSEGRSVFQLREAGYRIVGGDVVAVSEDHCHPAPGWRDALLRAWREHPDAIGVAGSVVNGTPDAAIDRGAFLITQTPFVAPLPRGRVPTIAGPNVAYRRDVLERMQGRGDLGTIELLDNAALARPGEAWVADDRIVVVHDQAMGLRATSVIEFHNGRTVAGFRRAAAGPGDVLRVLAAPVLPVLRAVRTVRQARTKPHLVPTLPASVAAVVWLQLCFAAGELLGYLRGPGRSPERLN